MVLYTKWTVQGQAQSLEEHQNTVMFLLIFVRLWGHIVFCQKGKIETNSGLYLICRSCFWGEREEFHGLLCQKLQKDPKARESKENYHREKWDHWVCREEQSLCCAQTSKQNDGCWADLFVDRCKMSCWKTSFSRSSDRKGRLEMGL